MISQQLEKTIANIQSRLHMACNLACMMKMDAHLFEEIEISANVAFAALGGPKIRSLAFLVCLNIKHFIALFFLLLCRVCFKGQELHKICMWRKCREEQERWAWLASCATRKALTWAMRHQGVGEQFTLVILVLVTTSFAFQVNVQSLCEIVRFDMAHPTCSTVCIFYGQCYWWMRQKLGNFWGNCKGIAISFCACYLHAWHIWLALFFF